MSEIKAKIINLCCTAYPKSLLISVASHFVNQIGSQCIQFIIYLKDLGWHSFYIHETCRWIPLYLDFSPSHKHAFHDVGPACDDQITVRGVALTWLAQILAAFAWMVGIVASFKLVTWTVHVFSLFLFCLRTFPFCSNFITFYMSYFDHK